MRLHQSIAKVLVSECPAIAKMALDGERGAPSTAMRRGSLVDQLVFGNAQFQVVTAPYASGPRKGQPAEDWTSKAAQAERDEITQRGWVPCLAHELERAQWLASQVKRELFLVSGIPAESCQKQLTVQWTTPLGVEAEGTPDLWFSDGMTIHSVDLKETTSANPEFLDAQIYNQRWDIQGAAYTEALSTIHGVPATHWICAQDHKTGLVSVRKLGEAYTEIGRQSWLKAQWLWQRCLETGVWPEYGARNHQPPRWVMAKELGKDV